MDELQEWEKIKNVGTADFGLDKNLI